MAFIKPQTTLKDKDRKFLRIINDAPSYHNMEEVSV